MKLVRGLLACAVGIFTGLGLALPAQADVIWGGANPVIAAQTSLVTDRKVTPEVEVTPPTYKCEDGEAVEVPGLIKLVKTDKGTWSELKHGAEVDSHEIPFPASGEEIVRYFEAKSAAFPTVDELTGLPDGVEAEKDKYGNPPYWTFTFKNDVKPEECPPTTVTTTVTETTTTEDGQLAVTGADTTGIAAAGGALVLSGGVLLGWLYLQRRRREALQE